MVLIGETEVLGEKPVPGPLCPPETSHGPLLSGSTPKYIKASNANTVCVLQQDFHIALDTSPKSNYSCVPPAYQNLGDIYEAPLVAMTTVTKQLSFVY